MDTERIKRVLVVDDEPVLGQLIDIILTTHGFEVSVAYNGLEGLRKVNAVKPDLVITDIVMPDMEGMELLRTLSRQGITIPVIVMSGNSLGTKFLDAAHLFGAQASLRKPFSKQELLDAVTRVLGNQHPLEQTDAVEGV
jgi:DNA-binding response OmpR family regulator